MTLVSSQKCFASGTKGNAGCRWLSTRNSRAISFAPGGIGPGGGRLSTIASSSTRTRKFRLPKPAENRRAAKLASSTMPFDLKWRDRFSVLRTDNCTAGPISSKLANFAVQIPHRTLVSVTNNSQTSFSSIRLQYCPSTHRNDLSASINSLTLVSDRQRGQCSERGEIQFVFIDVA